VHPSLTLEEGLGRLNEGAGLVTLLDDLLAGVLAPLLVHDDKLSLLEVVGALVAEAGLLVDELVHHLGGIVGAGVALLLGGVGADVNIANLLVHELGLDHGEALNLSAIVLEGHLAVAVAENLVAGGEIRVHDHLLESGKGSRRL